MRAPVEAPLRHGEPATIVTSPWWLEWFQQSFDRLMVSFNGRFGIVVPQSGDYDAGMVGADPVGTAAAGDAAHLIDHDHSAIVHANRVALDNVSGVNTGDVITTQIFGDATAGVYPASILAADDLDAPAYYEVFKTDSSANPVTITPATGTVCMQPSVDLTVQGEGIRLVRSASDNNWYAV